jgi:hypothetical protein
MAPNFVLPFRLLVVLASSTSGDQHFYEIVALFRPPPHQDSGRARSAGSSFARDDKELGPQLGKQIPGERPRETAETRHTSPQPSRHVRRKGAAPLRSAEEQTARTISGCALCAFLLSLQMESIN